MSTEQNWITTPVTAELLRGHLEVERTAHGLLPHRLPARARRQIPDDRLAVAEAHPSGVRLVFRTRATTVELDALPTKRAYRGFPPPADGVYDLLVDGRLTAQATVPGGNLHTVTDMLTQAAEFTEGPAGTARFTDLPDGEKSIEIWLPHAETTEVIALRTDAPVDPAPDGGRRVWLHHGSSISHGSNAVHPSAIWPALAASAGGVELINLGFGGEARVRRPRPVRHRGRLTGPHVRPAPASDRAPAVDGARPGRCCGHPPRAGDGPRRVGIRPVRPRPGVPRRSCPTGPSGAPAGPPAYVPRRAPP